MPLVSIDRVKVWYRTDSWVYKHLAYLFQNPLWTKNVPQGFSLCPMFWSAMFSMVIFRPLIVPFLRGFQWLIRLTRITKLIRYVDSKAAIIVGKGPCLGASTALGIIVLAVVSILGWSLWHGWLETRKLTEIGGTPSLFYTGQVLFVSWFGLMVAAATHKISEQDAKRFFRIIAALVVTHAFVVHPVLFGGVFMPIFGWIWKALTYTSSFGVDFVLYCVSLWYVFATLVVGFGIAFLWANRVGYTDHYMLDRKLRSVRKAVHARIATTIGEQLGRNRGSSSVWEKQILESITVRRIIYEIVDDLAWLRVDMNKLGVSISEERLKAIKKAFVVEWDKTTAALAKKKEPTWFDRKLKSFGRAVGGFFKKMALQVAAFVCYLWELVKAKKSGACPYMQFEYVQGSPYAPRVVNPDHN